jgi:hypothetical protein
MVLHHEHQQKVHSCFFNSIQALQQQKPASSIDELIQNVQSAFQELDAEKLNNVWLTLMCCMEESLWVNGGNNYVIPHISKQALARANQLPDSLDVSDEIIQFSEEYLAAHRNVISDNETDAL